MPPSEGNSRSFRVRKSVQIAVVLCTVDFKDFPRQVVPASADDSFPETVIGGSDLLV